MLIPADQITFGGSVAADRVITGPYKDIHAIVVIGNSRYTVDISADIIAADNVVLRSVILNADAYRGVPADEIDFGYRIER